MAQHSFILWDGKVEVLVNDKKIRELDKGESFGDLALQFSCTRTASIRTLSPCEFFALDRKTFRKVITEIQEKEFDENLDFINLVPFFSSMTQSQQQNIAQHLTSNRYSKGQMIVHEGDEANSYYVIKKGQVEIIKDGKVINKMKELDQFGEQALYEKSSRGASVVALSEVICVSLSRSDLTKVLGEHVQDAILYNVIRWAFKKSAILNEFTQVQMERMINEFDLLNFKKGQIVYKKGDVKDLIIILQGSFIINEIYPKGFCFGDSYLKKQQSAKVNQNNIVMKEDGIVAILSFDKLYKIIGRDYETTVLQNKISHESIMKISYEIRFNPLKIQDLINITFLGEGGFSKVYLAATKENKQFALKVIQKSDVINNKMEKSTVNVVALMKTLNFPFILTLFQTFKDDQRIYLLEEFIQGQVMFDMVRKVGILNTESTRFYVAQIILALEYLHKQGIVYRDLKPENVMVGIDGYIKIVDMDTAKKLLDKNGHQIRTYTVIGTPHYMAPEIMQGKGYNQNCDLFSLGVVIFELLSGGVPYGEDSDNPYDIYRDIIESEGIKFPNYVQNSRTKQFITQLLDKQPSIRLGGSYGSLKAHKWFNKFDWDLIYKKEIKPPQIPDNIITDQQIQINLNKGESMLKFIQKYTKTVTLPKSKVEDWDTLF